jgi:DMSO reductase anchor subunit
VNQVVLIEPVRHQVWQWPAVVNFITGGSASGLFLMCLMADQVGDAGFSSSLVKLTAPSLALLGFLAVGLEAGKPLSARYLLHHLQSSWMSREVLVGFVFVSFAVLDAFFSGNLFKVVAGFGAAGLLLCQGILVNRSRAVTAWNRNIVVLHFISSGMNLGFGILLILTPIVNIVIDNQTAWIGLLFLILNLLVWLHYMFLSRGDEFRKATVSLRRSKSVTFTVGFGHIVPALLLIKLLAATPLLSNSSTCTVLCLFSGISIVLGGIFQKSAILLQANLFREIRAELCSAEGSIP